MICFVITMPKYRFVSIDFRFCHLPIGREFLKNTTTQWLMDIKTCLRRIKDRYYWSNESGRTVSLQNYRNCQLQITRAHKNLPMVLTNTPSDAFEKISMDILGGFIIWNVSGKHNQKTHTYNQILPRDIAQAIDIANAFVNDFICIYFICIPKTILTD